MIMKDEHRMKLYEGKIGTTYLVESVHVEDAINRRLEALGVNEYSSSCDERRKQRNDDHQSPRNPSGAWKADHRRIEVKEGGGIMSGNRKTSMSVL